MVTSVPGLQVGNRPMKNQAEITPVVVATSLSKDNVMDDDFGRIFQR
jgi:hypothetical protein